MTIEAYFRERREQLGYSSREAARRGGVSNSYLHHLEHNGLHTLLHMRVDMLPKIAKAYQLSLSKVITLMHESLKQQQSSK